jgi:hypothetical protein
MLLCPVVLRFMCIQDEIQCAGAELVRLVRLDAKKHDEKLKTIRRGEGFDSNANKNQNDKKNKQEKLTTSSSKRQLANGTTVEVTQVINGDDDEEVAPYYALHVRRGDFQFKDVKISASEILKNINGNSGKGEGKGNGNKDSPLIPRGSLVYISTDDPKVTTIRAIID